MSYLKKIAIAGIVSLGILLFSKEASACSCAAAQPFLEVAQESDLVVRGVVHPHPTDDYDSLWLEVDDVLYGQEQRTNLRVWGGLFTVCAPGWRRRFFYDKGKYVMALYAATPEEGRTGFYAPSKNEERTDYVIGYCDSYYLEIADEIVRGNISRYPFFSETTGRMTLPEDEEMPIEEFYEAILAWP